MGTAAVFTLLIGLAIAAGPAWPAQDVPDRSAWQAVWKLVDTKRRNQTTAVAVGATRALTNAHVLYEFMRMQSTALVLTRERGQQRVGVVGPVAISAAYDLALLEADRPLPRHLRIARAVPLGRADQLHVAGFPRGRFATLRATQEVTTTTRGSFGLPLERIIEPGLSGGAVLAPNGDVVGISKTSSFNIAGVIPAATVREFLAGAIGVRCESRRLVPCLDQATAHARALAEGRQRRRPLPARASRALPRLPQLTHGFDDFSGFDSRNSLFLLSPVFVTPL